jgi:hypothetical protein
VIYELHVAGFTRHPSSGIPAERRGTYAELIEKIPYLRDLGVSAPKWRRFSNQIFGKWPLFIFGQFSNKPRFIVLYFWFQFR